MITIVDYGVGNLNAFLNIYKELGIQCNLATNKEQLQSATKIILPGVGHFDFAMQKLNESGMLPVLNDLVLNKKIPVLGVCVGMQMMAHSSEEGTSKGLCWIDAQVKKIAFPVDKKALILPHMGWNTIDIVKESDILKGFNKEEDFYFLHSYFMECRNPENNIAHTNYGKQFSCLVQNENIFGIQCHPEKSHSAGIRFLHNFANL